MSIKVENLFEFCEGEAQVRFNTGMTSLELIRGVQKGETTATFGWEDLHTR